VQYPEHSAHHPNPLSPSPPTGTPQRVRRAHTLMTAAPGMSPPPGTPAVAKTVEVRKVALMHRLIPRLVPMGGQAKKEKLK
jgi:hypothetical protein